MRTRLLLTLTLLLLAGCKTGTPLTLRFTGPTNADHASAAKILEARLEAYGSVDEVFTEHNTITLRGKFRALTPEALRALGRRGQFSLHLIDDAAAAAAQVTPPARLQRAPGSDPGTSADLCAPDLGALKAGIAGALVRGKAWLPMTGTQTEPCAVLVGDAKLTEADLDEVEAERDAQLGQPYLVLSFTSAGAELFAALTRQSVGQRLAIVLDGEVRSAPVIMEEISGGRAQLALPGVSFAEAEALARALDAGRLSAPYQASLTR